MATPTVRPAVATDRQALAELMIDMQRHHGAVYPPCEAIAEQLGRLPGGVELFVADLNGRLVGLAAVSTLYPGPGLSGGLFLKELYVTASMRGAGIGEAMMRQLARTARDRGLTRIDWTVAKTNDGAIDFYDALGAQAQTDRLFYRLTGEAFAALADLAVDEGEGRDG